MALGALIRDPAFLFGSREDAKTPRGRAWGGGGVPFGWGAQGRGQKQRRLRRRLSLPAFTAEAGVRHGGAVKRGILASLCLRVMLLEGAV